MNDRPTPDALAALLLRMAAGDRRAMADLYAALQKPLYHFVQSRLNDPFLSQDILHDVFVDVWRGAAGFEGRSSVRSWVYGIAWRKVIDVQRANRRLTFSDDLPEQEDASPSALSVMGAAQDALNLRGCMAKLKDDQRVAIELAFYQDLGYREISEVLGVPEGTVKTRVFHAKRLLQHCLEQAGVRGMLQ